MRARYAEQDERQREVVDVVQERDEQTEGDFKSAEPVEFQLYNLREDIGETRDLATTQPDKFNEMKALMLAKYHEVRAESPTWPTWTPSVPPGKKKK